MRSPRPLAAALAALALSACSAAPPCPPAAPSAPPQSASAAVGHLDSDLVEAIATYAGVDKVEIYVDRGGRMTKASVYHADAAKIPAAARAAADRQLPGGKPKHFESERYAGEGAAVEIEIDRADQRACEVSLTPEGALRYVECKVPVAELPRAIADKVAALVAGGAIEEVEQKKGPRGEAWSVETKKDGVTHVLRFSAAGELTGRGVQVTAKITVEAR